jgi:hypothetical protein
MEDVHDGRYVLYNIYMWVSSAFGPAVIYNVSTRALAALQFSSVKTSKKKLSQWLLPDSNGLPRVRSIWEQSLVEGVHIYRADVHWSQVL